MGTRADFYIGVGEQAEWVGSVAWDGYEWDEDRETPIAKATTEDEYRKAVEAVLSTRRDATRPAQGWPWPWEDSTLTDYAYCFEDNRVVAYCGGGQIIVNDEGRWDTLPERNDWPNMKDRMAVAFDSRSGLVIVSRRCPHEAQ